MPTAPTSHTRNLHRMLCYDPLASNKPLNLGVGRGNGGLRLGLEVLRRPDRPWW
jgi:hypothetical protein